MGGAAGLDRPYHRLFRSGRLQGKTLTVDEFELVALAGGVYSLRARSNGQTFHPVVGPVAEAEAIHVGGARLVERADAMPPGEPFVIWDVGLGAAANALTAIRALATGGTRMETVELHSFDATFGPFDFALQNRLVLAYPCGYEPEMEALRRDGTARVPLINGGAVHWHAHLGDFPSWLAGGDEMPAPHAVFYDPYSPGVNPEMWTLETFAALRARLRPETPCLLTTYTRSTAVRVTLLLAGFFVGLGSATGEKDETTVATNDPALLQRPLGRGWLEKKVYASTNAAPLRAASAHGRAPISEEDFETLRAHAQFVPG